MPDPFEHQFLTIAQVAEELNVDVVQIRALLGSGGLRASRLVTAITLPVCCGG
ncbi:hypothetical protein ACFVGV_16625 [Pseudarthrobacter scleromae]|uniref:hypothetical protein n=1 Tax=Pseudarthrobacter scleromae TaxID=158897 RepID=UPI0036458DA0